MTPFMLERFALFLNFSNLIAVRDRDRDKFR